MITVNTSLNPIIEPVVALKSAIEPIAEIQTEVGNPTYRGPEGKPGPQGIEGDSAYEIAVDHGFVGTEKQWLESLTASVEPISNLELDELLK